ncbi:MAG: hypothetical protein E6Q68_01750 [Polynucleobacter sp.]|nr:MAG: hypothetical protein E6Q68_01750 [Polynucleobacter sp.]
MINREIIEITASLRKSSVHIKATYPDNESETRILGNDSIKEKYAVDSKKWIELFEDDEKEILKLFKSLQDEN